MAIIKMIMKKSGVEVWGLTSQRLMAYAVQPIRNNGSR